MGKRILNFLLSGYLPIKRIVAKTMSNQQQEGKGLMVTYTASVYYEAFEVDEYDLTEQAAIENLLDGVSREPSNWGELEVEWVEE